MPKLRSDRVRRKRLAGIVLALVALLATTDLTTRILSQFWVGNAMFTALVAFGATLALTVLVVGEVTERRAVSRWSFVADLALRRLSGRAFAAMTGLVVLVGFKDYPEQMADAYERVESTGERPGREAPALLPIGFESVLDALLDRPEAREMLADDLASLTSDMEEAITSWSPVMLGSGELADFLNAFGMMRHALGWTIGSLYRVDQSPQERLDFWSNLRVFFALGATVDAIRREALGEPNIFGMTMDEHDAAWGLPFRAQKSALGAARAASRPLRGGYLARSGRAGGSRDRGTPA